MLQHHLVFIYRSFKRFKTSFFINLIGLSTALACALFIFLWVDDELHFDKFHQNDPQLFQVMENQQTSTGINTSAETPAILGDVLAESMPEIQDATVSTPASWFPQISLFTGDKQLKAAGLFAGKNYFQVFSYPLIQGNEQSFQQKDGVFISESLAKRLYNTTDQLIGKTITWQLDQFKKQAIITGIFKDIPHNSSVQLDFALPFSAFNDLVPGTMKWDNRGPFLTYLVLKKTTDLAKFDKKISQFMRDKTNDLQRNLFLRSYSDQYLYGNYENGVKSGGRIAYVQLFSLTAIFILLIACINYMNLFTAKSTQRIKQVGIQKALGAQRKTLTLHYLSEAIILSFLAVCLALILVIILLPQFNGITEKQLILYPTSRLVFGIVAIALLCGLISGSYPALYLSGFKPIAVLRGKISSSAGVLWARKGLVVFQFTISIVFLVILLVIYQQVKFAQHKNLGFEKDHVIYFEPEGKIPGNLSAFIAEIRQIPGVVNVSSMIGNLIGGMNAGVPWKGNKPDQVISFRSLMVDYGLIESLGIQLSAGRTFSSSYGADSTKIIFNEAAIKAMDIRDPIGKVIQFRNAPTEIIGIVKDFHFQSLHEQVKPAFFTLLTQGPVSTIMVKLKAGTERETLGRLQNFYKTYNPGFTFDYKFLDQDYQAQYISEKRVAILSRYFAGLALLISCLGLFGLAAFTAERRTKEIGIRKVLGATNLNIVRLLSHDFNQLVLIALVIALPLSYILAKNWLDSFAYRIDLSVWYFIGSGLIALSIAWLTVAGQAFKAANTNPAKSLKME